MFKKKKNKKGREAREEKGMYKYFEGGKKKKPGMGALIGREINTEERRNNVCAHMHNNDQTNREREFKSERIRKKGK